MNALADLVIDRAAVSALLVELGVDLSHSLAPAIVLATTDVLLAVELAEALPPEANFDAALGQLKSFTAPPDGLVPARVVEVQWQVLDALMQGPQAPVIETSRLSCLHERLQALSG